MFNVGGPEILVIMLLALIVLGPQRLPEAAKQLGKMRAEIRKLSTGFQDEIRNAFEEESAAAGRRNGSTPGTPPAAVEPSAVGAATAAAAPDALEPAPPPRARRRTEPLRANGRSAGRSAPK